PAALRPVVGRQRLPARRRGPHRRADARRDRRGGGVRGRLHRPHVPGHRRAARAAGDRLPEPPRRLPRRRVRLRRPARGVRAPAPARARRRQLRAGGRLDAMTAALTDVLRCELPLQLAPMGSVSATPALPLAIARAGGHAMYPGLALPPAALAPAIDALAAETAAFGVNFIVPMMNRGSLELAAERAPYVDFFLAEPDPALVALAREHGAVCGWQVESADEARAAEAAGCGVVIAKGWESG